ncbi:hypothetical protein GGI07_000930 [Coemansia sp. Benny D115]|nr:hypothetical protein GGI07_000930 [Coemansia sp. Benny D115]
MCTAVTVPAKTPRIGASPCWFSPIIASLETEVEPNCKLCDCTMDSWDLYFDHLIFDPNHKLNEYREMTEQRYSRFKQNISHAQKRILGSPSRYSRIYPLFYTQ